MTSNCNCPTAPTMKSAPNCGLNSWVTPSSANPSSAFLRCLALSGSVTRDALQDFRREIRQTREAKRATLREAVADAQHAMVGDADDVAGEGLFRQFAVGGEEHDRRIDAHLLAGVLDLELHAAAESSRCQPHEGDPVAVVGVHNWPGS